MSKLDFQPVILGSDENAYSIAREFHEEYGIKSIVLTKAGMLATTNSIIVDIIIVRDLDDAENFNENLMKVWEQIQHRSEKFILLACNENYAELVIRNKDKLEKKFLCPFLDEYLLDEVIYKEKFYEMCEKHQLSYPKTVIFKKGMIPEEFNIPFGFPIVVKPSDSVTYFNAQFEGKEKAYILDDFDSFIEKIHLIYSSTYKESLIIQDYIPGGDSAMYVLNAYVDQHHKVRLMSLGHVVLEDCTPAFLGNYVAISASYDEEIYKKYTKFLEDIKFQGFANIDLKFDKRDGEFKIFELNVRQGRSHYFVTASGYNLMKPLVDDMVYNKPSEAVYTNGDMLLYNVPLKTLRKYVKDVEVQNNVNRLLKEKKTARTLIYDKDSNLLRKVKLYNYYRLYHKRFEKYFKHEV